MYDIGLKVMNDKGGYRAAKKHPVHYHSGTSLFSNNRGIPKANPDLVPNSGHIPDHFWHFGRDPDQVRNSGPFWSLCARAQESPVLAHYHA